MRIDQTLERQEKKISGSLSGKAAVISQPGTVKFEAVKIPEPEDNEVRIRLEGSGLCASNIPVWEGRDWFDYPVAPGEPGHEGWGIVDALGSGVTDLEIGDRVTALSYHAYATHDIAPRENVVKLPETLKDQPFPGEPLGCAMNIFDRSEIRKGDRVAIVGSGFLGNLLIQLAKSAGAFVIAISRRDSSLETARSCGADHLVKMDDHLRIIDQVKKITNGQFCSRVIDCTGKEWPLNLSIELTAVRGKLIVAGFHQDGMRNLNVQLLNWRGIDMISAHERDSQKYISGIRNAIRAVEAGQIDPFPLFTHHYPLGEIDKAFQALAEKPEGFIKALVLNT